MFTVAKVVVENTTYCFDKEYSYLVPGQLLEAARAGCRVRVPFGRGNRRRTGLILEVDQTAEKKGLKPLLAVLDREPLLTNEGFLLLRYLKECTFCTWFDALRVLIPAGIGVAQKILYSTQNDGGDLPLLGLEREIFDFVSTKKKPVEESQLCEELGISPADKTLADLVERGHLVKTELLRQRVLDDKVCMVRLAAEGAAFSPTAKQKQVIGFLEEAGSASLKEICYYLGVTRAVVDRLRDKGAVEYFDILRPRNPYEESADPLEEAPSLSPQQQAALEGLSRLLDGERPKPALLYGVTGSGKTQVFLSLIKQVLDRGRRVIVMVPEISLTSQTVRSFHRRFGGRVAVLHSGLSLGERMDEWKRIKSGGADIVVGTRSAVFAPLDNIGLIVMDEEQEHTYKSEKSPRFHARDVAKLRCEFHGGLLLLASATPSVESYYAAREGTYSLVTLEERWGRAILPDVYVVDMKEPENLEPSPSLSETLLTELRYNLEHGEQSILLLNRRGYSTVVKCSSCGMVAECPNCSVSLTYHNANDSLVCHYCGYTQKKAVSCSHCSSEMIRYAGAGTQKIQEELAALYPGARILRVDMDTTLSKFSHEKLFDAFLREEYDIMVGTQMVAKGLNFPTVTLVGVLGADQSLYAGDFRSFERSFALLTQVVGRSGRGMQKGRAFIQTYSPENPIIQLAADQDYPGFYRQEILSRKLHLYPPFCSLAGIGFVGEDLEEVRCWSGRFLEKFREVAAASYRDLPIRVLGPVPADTLKAAGKYRFKLVLKCRNDRKTRALLREMLAWFLGECKTVSMFVDMYYDRI